MGTIHELILAHGRQEARRLAGDSSPLIDLAVAVLEDESHGIGVTYSGFCMTSLPHKRLLDDERWIREHGRVKLVVEPGIDERRDGSIMTVGVPYGARARLIMIYLQTEALRNRSREVELGRSMNAWLVKMGIDAGGTTYKAVQDQAHRISHCRLTFFWQGERGDRGFQKDSIVSSGIRLSADDDLQGSLWQPTVKLSETFYDALTKHPVPVLEAAIKQLSSSSMAIDLYIWLAYRLHVLSKPQHITWVSLHSQFGGGYKSVAGFKYRFGDVLDMALAVYPEATVTRDETGITLHPSAPPIPERMVCGLVR